MIASKKHPKTSKTPLSKPTAEKIPPRPDFETLRVFLLALDERLVQALAAAELAYGSQAAGDPMRGLYLSLEDVDRLLRRKPGESFLSVPGLLDASQISGEAADGGRWGWLRRRFGLDDFDLQALLIGLAPEIDPRYERIYAYLQDDVTRRRPTVGLVLDLLAATAGQRLRMRERFSPAAPLLGSGLARLADFANNASPGAGLLSSSFVLDESLVRFLIGPDGPDPRISDLCEWRPAHMGAIPDGLFLGDEMKTELQALSQAKQIRAYFQGRPGSGQIAAAQALASSRGQPLCHAAIPVVTESRLGGEAALALLLRCAEFNQALALISGADLLLDDSWLHRTLGESQAEVILMGSTAWRTYPDHPVGLTQVTFELPKPANRRASWQAAAAAYGIKVDEIILDELTERFRLRPGQVSGAAASLAASNSTATSRAAKREAWFAAARAQTGQALDGVAQKITPRQRFEDLVLPEDSLAQLHDMSGRVTQRDRVMDQWGFGKRLSLGRGVTALFAGPPGTGKTMAAEVVAGALGLDLYRIDLARVVSKYIGETEKNLNEVFAAAEDSNAILFFDEADALFGRRSEVHDAHDRYANIEVAYLLQKMEQYEGTAILATNLRQNLDEAFLRRLSFVINFPFPDEDSRRRIWQGIWPDETPLDSKVDFSWLAQRFRMSGGNIRNIALAAAYLAAQDGGRVTGEHLLVAARREYHKMGKLFPETERAEAG